jgi:23S rRNA pseudouridine955/2504/2580 synthase
VSARREFTIDDAFAGGRLETFLRRYLGLPRTLALKAIRKGWVRLDGRRTKVDARLEHGARVVVTNPTLVLPALEGGPSGHAAASASRAVAVPGDLVARARASVRRLDDDLIVSSKPSGAVVHAGSRHEFGWIDALAAVHGGELAAIGRLDRDTSGLLLVGRRRAATRFLFEALRAGRVSREYVALVSGRLAQDDGVIDLPLAKVRDEEGHERVEPRPQPNAPGSPGGSAPLGVDAAFAEDSDEGPSGREARTRFRVVERFREATLVACRIETGRTHQIRAHFASIGHPLLGDVRYGGTLGAPGATARGLGLRRLFLHAGLLEFSAPGGRTERVTEPLPEELARALALLRRGARDAGPRAHAPSERPGAGQSSGPRPRQTGSVESSRRGRRARRRTT